MWSPSDEESDETPIAGVPEPTGAFRHVEPSGRTLRERAARRDADRLAVQRLAAEIERSLQEYARYLRYVNEGDT